MWKCCQQFYTSLTFFECFDSVTKTFFNLIIVWYHFWSQNRHIWWRWSKRIYWLNELLRCAVVVKRKQMRSCHRHILFTFRSLFILTLKQLCETHKRFLSFQPIECRMHYVGFFLRSWTLLLLLFNTAKRMRNDLLIRSIVWCLCGLAMCSNEQVVLDMIVSIHSGPFHFHDWDDF